MITEARNILDRIEVGWLDAGLLHYYWELFYQRLEAICEAD